MPANNKLTLSHQARMDIAHYIRHCNYEIGGFGYVTMTDSGDFYVDEIFLVEQTVTGGSVDFMDDGLAYAIDKATTDNRVNDLKFCWHSHVNMAAFWSSTDESMIAGTNNGMTPYLVSLVQNKQGEYKTRVDFYPTGEFGQFTNQVEYELDLYYEQTAPPEHIINTYNKLVTENKSTSKALTGKYDAKPVSESRQDFLTEKVHKDGYNALSSYEKDQYDSIVMSEWSAMDQMGWGSYADYEDDFGSQSIDTSPLSDTTKLTKDAVKELMEEPSK
jgi:hypothetical protein